MTWTTELPTKPGWYYRRVISANYAELDIVNIFNRQWRHETIKNICVERFGEDGAIPVSGYGIAINGDKFQYEFQLVKPPEE